jgi:hypothetical protein
MICSDKKILQIKLIGTAENVWMLHPKPFNTVGGSK